MDRKTYRRYLKTKRWQKLRFEVLKRSKGKCERCGYEPWKPNGLQVHHLTYSNVGNEKLNIKLLRLHFVSDMDKGLKLLNEGVGS